MTLAEIGLSVSSYPMMMTLSPTEASLAAAPLRAMMPEPLSPGRM